jgi:hypothetical protein
MGKSKPRHEPVAVLSLDADSFAVVYNGLAIGIAVALRDEAGVEALAATTRAVLAGFGQARLDELLARLERTGERAFPTMARGDGVSLNERSP